MTSRLAYRLARRIANIPADTGPSFASVSPLYGKTAGSTAVTLTGTGFTLATSATLGGVALTSFTVVNDTTITGVTGVHAAGAVSGIVVGPAGSSTLSNAFTYAAAPTVSGISPTSGDTAGGTPVTITGTGFTGATGATVGGVAITSFVVAGPTSITGTTGAHAAGASDVVVTGPSDAGSGTAAAAFTYSSGAFDPATLPLTGWWSADRQPFTASPWVGEASAGSSATHDLTEATNPPTASSGYADFDGTNDQLGSATANNVFFGAHGSFACLFYADAAPAPTGVAYGDGSLFGDWGNAETTFGFTSDGICGAVYATTYKRLDIACGTGGWHLAQFKWDGTNLKGRLDSGTWSSIAAGDYTPSAPGAIFVGRSYGAAIFFDGKIREVMTADSALSDDDFDDIVSYVNDTYGLAL